MCTSISGSLRAVDMQVENVTKTYERLAVFCVKDTGEFKIFKCEMLTGTSEFNIYKVFCSILFLAKKKCSVFKTEVLKFLNLFPLPVCIRGSLRRSTFISQYTSAGTDRPGAG